MPGLIVRNAMHSGCPARFPRMETPAAAREWPADWRLEVPGRGRATPLHEPWRGAWLRSHRGRLLGPLDAPVRIRRLAPQRYPLRVRGGVRVRGGSRGRIVSNSL